MNSSKKKILYLSNLSPNKFGSMEEHALFLSRELKQRGHECYLGFVSEPEPEIRCKFEGAGAHILSVYCGNTPLIGSRSSLRLIEVLELRRMVLKNRIDLVHINFMGLTNPVLLGVYLTRAKIVYTEHASGLPLKRSLLKHILSKCIHFVISQRVSKYIGVSNYVRDRLLLTHHVSGGKTVTIYNGINIERFCPQNQEEARKELGLPVRSPIVCSVAMLIPEKGIQCLINAVALLVQGRRLPDLLALVVGEGFYREELERLVSNLGITNNIRFLGRRSDVQKVIAASDVVVVPSLWEEAFGLIVAEAMGCERPLVASNVGGIPELVSDGFSGLLVPSGDSDRMAELIEVLLSNATYRKELGKNARNKAMREYNLDFQVNKLADLYNIVLQK